MAAVATKELQTAIPGAEKVSLVSCKVLIDGQELDPAIPIFKITIEKEVNRIPTAILTIPDGDVSLQDFPVSNKNLFKPGNKVEIQLGYETKTESVFKGIVTAHGSRITRQTSQLVVTCRDTAIQMTLARKNAAFYEMTDSDIASQLIGQYNGLKADVESTDIQHLQLLQCNLTDWDFVLGRFDVLGMFCTVEDGTVSIKKPDLKQDRKFDVVYGATLIDYQANIDARTQATAAEASSWDYSAQALNNGAGVDPSLNAAGNLGASDLAAAMAFESEIFAFPGKWTEAELKALADARLIKRRLAAIKGNVRFQGTNKILPNEFITIGGIGERFSGPVFVSAVKHTFEGGDWITMVNFGMDPVWFAEKINPWHPMASQGLIPVTQGLYNGVVTDIEDPENEFRIRVKIPVIDAKGEGIWARIATLDAGNNRGTFFRPELNDEVVVGFMGTDMRDAVVLGMLHSSSLAAPLTPAKDNYQKGYVSKTNFKLIFDDEKKSLTIESPKGKKITVSDEDKILQLEDENGNQLILDEKGITLKTDKDMLLDVGGKFNLKCGGDASAEAMNLALKGSSKAGMEAAQVEVKGSGQTTIKGGMVMIN
ncbi:Rhs element Vgr protein [Chitinophaga jiangningensis]|uniref:Rhs element Vgr protein n=1 Tax=Chitinophaga jiangningensis TaxID=1419482 RepID=A0A1M7AA40_9BACT|nr:type VI secretion system tip protein VgrG [Chitinophaga jiangningensis]SHL39654.1 Rhs element Vgr protein [Chitinophaga jiangningensis]